VVDCIRLRLFIKGKWETGLIERWSFLHLSLIEVDRSFLRAVSWKMVSSFDLIWFFVNSRMLDW